MIKVMDAAFNFLGEIDVFSSLQFTRRYFKPGEFELHVPVGSGLLDILIKGNIIFYDNGRKSGIIEHREVSRDNEETMVIKGFTLGSFTNRRITVPPAEYAYDSVVGKGETALRHYVNANCIAPADTNRIIINLILQTDLLRGADISYQSRYKQLDEELQSIAEASGLGWDIALDLTNNKYIFKVFEGKNLVASQGVNPPVIFSIDFDNVSKQDFTDSSIGYKNFGYCGGQGEGTEREIVAVGNVSTSLTRRETFIDARDVQDSSDLSSRGLQKLAELDQKLTFTNTIVNNTFVYETDWDLGDIVTCMNKKWGVTMDARITEVKEIYESSGFRIEATFGNNIPTLTEKLKMKLSAPLTEKSVTVTSATAPSDPNVGQVWIELT